MMAALKASLIEFGAVEPVIINKRSSQIVGGHQRLSAAAALDWEEYPYVEVDLDPQDEIALNIALNRITGDWDFPKLAQLLSEISTTDADLVATGFTADEVNDIIAEYLPPIDEDDSGGQAPPPPAPPPPPPAEEFERVQFGMYSFACPLAAYNEWVKALRAESVEGASPIALGLIIAQKLGLATSQIAVEEPEEPQEVETDV